MQKKVDSRVRTLVENGVHTKTRAFFVIIGDRGRDQVVNLHYLSTKLASKKPSVLWCYKKELGFSSHRKKRMKQIKRSVARGEHDSTLDDPFELFVSSTNIRYCFYKETEQVLGKTFGMCVLQDFEALTPNLLCRTIETVEGGGVIILLLKTMDSLKQLYRLSMDAHSNLRSETHQDFEPRFNERFILSLKGCESCLVLDDELNVLPLSEHAKRLRPVKDPEEDSFEMPKTATEIELDKLKESMSETQPIGPILSVAKTFDQAKAVMAFLDAVSEKSLNRTVVLTAARGRGKSAALGLAIATAIAYGYSNIFVTAPSPENLGTVFEFILKGFDKLGMVEHQHYELVQAEGAEFNKALVRVNVFRDHRQTVQYVAPTDHQHLMQAELVVIDEAAAIPLPTVKKLFGSYLVLMSSTVNGYEGTGRALSLKLVEELRQGKAVGRIVGERTLREVSIDEPIRYAPGDAVESWLGRLLCLGAAQVPSLKLTSLPLPSECELFLVNRDALFSHHEASERFLFKVMSLFVSSHYKNTPNDMLLMSDAPAHHVFVMLPPLDRSADSELPEVFVAIQVCIEGAITKEVAKRAIDRGNQPAGDLIPWTLQQQFFQDGFLQLSGARIVRIATHPALHRKGYAKEALRQLISWFEQRSRGDASFAASKNEPRAEPDGSGEGASLLTEELKPRVVPPLLELVSDIPPSYELDYIGTSFGLTLDLYDFWRKSEFRPVYLRQSMNDITGENSCIMIRALSPLQREGLAAPFADRFVNDFRSRFLRLLQGTFRDQPVRLALSVVDPPRSTTETEPGREGVPESLSQLSSSNILYYISRDDIYRLQQYVNGNASKNLILDVVPTIAQLFFSRRMEGVQLSQMQCVALVGMGCQHKTADQVAAEFGIQASQLLALFMKAMHKITLFFHGLLEAQVEEEQADPTSLPERSLEMGKVMPGGSVIVDSLKDEQTEGGRKVSKKLEAARGEILKTLGNQYAVAADEGAFQQSLQGRSLGDTSISVKRKEPSGEEANQTPRSSKGKGKGKKKRRTG